jgi:hypothetical protein
VPFEPLLDGLITVAQKHGFLAGLLTAVILFLCWFLWKMFREVINSKDGEIERLAGERNKLQDLILRNRSSSDDKKEGD